MSLGWSDLTSEGGRYFSELERLAKMEVVVGFQEGAAEENGASLADVAAYNEYGTSTIPARPFMQQSFENHERELQEACDEANKAVSNGGTAEDALNTIGVFIKGLVQDEIVSGSFEPNAPSTVARKGSDTPLVDTGNMRQSVNYEVRESRE